MVIYKIYTLSDPITNEIRYVGKTVGKLYKRLSAHYRDKSISYKTNWIKTLKEKGLKPNIRILEISDEFNWVEREKYWISYYREKTKLTNYLEGGQGLPFGYKHSGEAKEKIRQAALKNLKGRFQKGHIPTEEILKLKSEKCKKKICQISYEGELIKIWNGTVDASNELNINNTNIHSALKKQRTRAGGFYWCYFKNFENFQIIKDESRFIVFINENNEEFIYNSIQKCAETLNLSRRVIDSALRKNGKYKNYYFKYMIKR